MNVWRIVFKWGRGVTHKSANFLRQKQVRKRGGGTPLGTKSAKQYLTGSLCNIVINREDPPPHPRLRNI